jgi:hypothetical protein
VELSKELLAIERQFEISTMMHISHRNHGNYVYRYFNTSLISAIAEPVKHLSIDIDFSFHSIGILIGVTLIKSTIDLASPNYTRITVKPVDLNSKVFA